ncbi:Protein Red [Trichoplax sp. H2]|nr:Protein Red [Trichoplax sp. H2]|eukprot:RDD36475.1 Protein Red [Trichoplax sp. H2]
MPEVQNEPFSNPIAPPTFHRGESKEEKLTNDDFRRMLMTPRPKSSEFSTISKKDEKDTAQFKRHKKKSTTQFAKEKSEEDQWKKEIANKYRDRAKERRDGVDTDYQNAASHTDTRYRTIGPLGESGDSAAERRIKEIQESKYLGGDMEHTHLVKGLDFALLQKVREQMTTDERDEIIEEEDLSTQNKVKQVETEEISFRTRLAKNIHNIVFKSSLPLRNEFFASGRMAYAVDLNDDEGESDIPTTIIRSKADFQNAETQSDISTNDIVINKLTQILAHLRQGLRSKKLKKKERAGKEHVTAHSQERPKVIAPEGNMSIFDDVGSDYLLDLKSKKDKKSHQMQPGTYFKKPVDDNNDKDDEFMTISSKDYVKKITEKFSKKENRQQQNIKAKAKTVPAKKNQGVGSSLDYYAECYPGAMEVDDAMADSDEEADYSKMDMGNKKGPVGRWDFENEEDYNKYMEKREALPKAAFQFGVKMADGRKTRRQGVKDDKSKLDREWQQISNIIKKRKEMGTGGPVSGSAKKLKESD